MADQFSLTGSYQATPAFGSPSAIGAIIAPVDEELILVDKFYDQVQLTVDGPVSVPFGGGVVNAHVVILKATGGKVTARFTSADGTTQAVPVDSFAVVMSRTVPFTALDLTRIPGQLTAVDVFLGQNS
jgi:hypothetical protein